jgi:hypothetical protein
VNKANSHLPSSECEFCPSHVEHSNGLNSYVRVNCGLCSSSDEKATGGHCSIAVEKASTGGPCSPVFNREYGGPHLNLLPSSPSHLTQGLKSPGGGQNYLSIGLQIPKSASTAFTRAFTGKIQKSPNIQKKNFDETFFISTLTSIPRTRPLCAAGVEGHSHCGHCPRHLHHLLAAFLCPGALLLPGPCYGGPR